MLLRLRGRLFLARLLRHGEFLLLVRIDKVKSEVPPGIFLPLSALLSSLLLLSSALLLFLTSALLLFLASILPLLIC